MGICFSRAKKETLENVPPSIWGIEVTKSDGTQISMNQYKDKKALIVVNVNENTKGTEPGFNELNYLSDKYKHKGIEILAFPGIMSTKPKQRKEVYQTEAISLNDQKKVQLFSSVQINGSATHSLYKYLRTNSTLYNPVKKNSIQIQSAFTKFLVDRFGNVVRVYSPNTTIKGLEDDLENLLQHT